MEPQSINDEPMDAVTFHDPEAVKHCLENSVDPNYTLHRGRTERVHSTDNAIAMVMFRISDAHA